MKHRDKYEVKEFQCVSLVLKSKIQKVEEFS